ncbi:MAG: hypothetical protein GFH27_549281n54 [Chloroflexi bacterium AL-W]|nr:hypothetical protein [Chloroflexi bacterium AL-N1]NOK65940.1 hypothetical protein [Chloroflexi bacterium AL-N10]NOK72821.1 hypothetical protein [Chloroflexi bacterium AL-N5]NOK79718.1 hypothetical protein [Chloroflexi bacterium AL-W]NOK88426.1 hypothetical protein [Chloroflexi bacterium AL-N15]
MKPLRMYMRSVIYLALAAVLLNACMFGSQKGQEAVALPTAQIEGAVPTQSSVVIEGAPVIATPSITPIPTEIPPAPTPTLQPIGPGDLAFPLKTEQLEFGAVAHLFYTDRYTPLVAARDAGFGWVRQQIHWKDQEGPAGNYAWGELDYIVDAVNAQDLKILISVVQSPSFYTSNGSTGMPANPQNFGDFLAALAQHYDGRVHAIEIWNEQNLAYENGGQVSLKDAGHYVEILKESYTRIKAVNPNIYIVAGPPASTSVNSPGVAVDDLSYYRAMYSYQNGIIRNYMDAQGVHPGGSANPPDTLWPDNPSPADGWTTESTFYFRHIENVRALMEEYGMDQHQVWITEFGWATQNNSPGFEFGNQISYEQQAEYIVGAMRLAKEEYPWVGAMFLWNLNFGPLQARNGNPYHEQASFSILNGDYSPRPAYWAIQQYIGEVRTAQNVAGGE